MKDFKDVHHILIGYDRVDEYVINRELIRYNFPGSLDLWITTVFNGDMNKIASGCGENTFIKLDSNTGYAYGALDAINAGLEFASAGYRDVIVLTNFDGLFFSQTKYESLIDDFLDSGMPFGAGIHQSHNFPMSDLMLFKKSFLKDLLPIRGEVHSSRREIEFLKKEYEGTQLGFDNVEEWILNALYNVGNPDDLWWKFQRDGHPRYRWTDKYAFGHLHEMDEIKEKINQYRVAKGTNITKLMGIKIPHNPIDKIRSPDGSIVSR